MPDDDETLLASLYPALRRFAAVVGAVDAEPDDLVQEAVARALGVGPLVDFTNPGGYLRTSIVHLPANDRRSVRRRDGAFARVAGDLSISSVDDYPSDLDVC